MCLTPCSVAIEFSILRATSVSSCAGDAPGSDAVTVTVGRSMSGKFWIFIARKLISADGGEHDEEQHPGDRVPDRPGRDVDHGLGGVARARRRGAPALIAGGVSTTRTVSPSARKPPPMATTRASGASPAVTSMRSPKRRPTSILVCVTLLSATDPEDVAEAFAQLHRALRQRQRARAADVELAAREHAGARAAGRRQVDVDDAVARLRVDRRRDHAHRAGDRRAAGRRDGGARARLDLRQVGRRDLGAPFEAALADHAEQLLAGRQDGADGRAARRDDAVVGRDDGGLADLELARLQRGALRVEARARGALGGDVLVDRRLAERAGRAQALRALGVGGGVGRASPRPRRRRRASAAGRPASCRARRSRAPGRA